MSMPQRGTLSTWSVHAASRPSSAAVTSVGVVSGLPARANRFKYASRMQRPVSYVFNARRRDIEIGRQGADAPSAHRVGAGARLRPTPCCRCSTVMCRTLTAVFVTIGVGAGLVTAYFVRNA